jgi:acetate kinase
MRSHILTVNGGSSTIKFAVFRLGEAPTRILSGQVQGIGSSAPDFTAIDTSRNETHHATFSAGDHRQAAHDLIDWIKDSLGNAPLQAIGHRVVHGGVRLDRHQAITADLMRELRRTQPLDLAHLPREIALIEAFRERFPTVLQVACFDTAFTRALPPVAQILPVPLRYFKAGIRRLGFHGLSYMYLVEELHRIEGTAADGRLILAHLGSGASMAALHRGVPVETSMAFTPTSGLMMSTRSGDIDPGLLVYIMRTEKLTAEQMDQFVSHDCGLAGVSESTGDMREVIAHLSSDEKSRQAFDLFCYEAKKWIGAYAAVLGGIETLVFSGGIGEHSPEVRLRICDGLEFLGLHLDPARNAGCTTGADIISPPASRVVVRVIPTDEELMIARIVSDLIARKAEVIK